MVDEKPDMTASDENVIEAHLEALERLPYGPLFFDRTSAVDFRLVEKGETALADALAMIEEKLAAAADGGDPAVREPKGVGKLLRALPDVRRQLADLLARILPVLGNPAPADLAGRVPVAVDLHLGPQQAAGLGLVRRRRIDASTN